MSKQLARRCYPVKLWHGRDANPGPLGPKVRALTTMPLNLTVPSDTTSLQLSAGGPFQSLRRCLEQSPCTSHLSTVTVAHGFPTAS